MCVCILIYKCHCTLIGLAVHGYMLLYKVINCSCVYYIVCRLDTSVMLHWMSKESLSIVKCVGYNEPAQRPYYLKVNIAVKILLFSEKYGNHLN